ncbi:unnamed protein product, partial [Tilletia controversa]
MPNIQHQALAAAHAFWERQQHDAHQQSLVAQQHEDQQRLHLFQQGQAVRAQEEVARRNEEIRQVAFRHQLERQRQDDDRRQQRERDWEHAQASRRQAEQQPLQQYRNYEAQPARQQAQQGQHAPQHTRLHDQQLPQDNSIQQSQRLTTLQGQNLVAMAQNTTAEASGRSHNEDAPGSVQGPVPAYLPPPLAPRYPVPRLRPTSAPQPRPIATTVNVGPSEATSSHVAQRTASGVVSSTTIPSDRNANVGAVEPQGWKWIEGRDVPTPEAIAACQRLREYNGAAQHWISQTFGLSHLQIRDLIIEGNGCFSVKTMSNYNRFQKWYAQTEQEPRRQAGESVNDHNTTIGLYWDSLHETEQEAVMVKVNAWYQKNIRTSKLQTKAAVRKLRTKLLRLSAEAEDLWGISLVAFIASCNPKVKAQYVGRSHGIEVFTTALERSRYEPTPDTLASAFWCCAVDNLPPSVRDPNSAVKAPLPIVQTVKIVADFNLEEKTDHCFNQVVELLSPSIVKILHAALLPRAQEFTTPEQVAAWEEWQARSDGGTMRIYKRLFSLVKTMGYAVAGWPKHCKKMIDEEGNHQPGLLQDTITVTPGGLANFNEWSRPKAKFLLAQLIRDSSTLHLKKISADGQEVDPNPVAPNAANDQSSTADASGSTQATLSAGASGSIQGTSSSTNAVRAPSATGETTSADVISEARDTARQKKKKTSKASKKQKRTASVLFSEDSGDDRSTPRQARKRVEGGQGARKRPRHRPADESDSDQEDYTIPALMSSVLSEERRRELQVAARQRSTTNHRQAGYED